MHNGTPPAWSIHACHVDHHAPAFRLVARIKLSGKRAGRPLYNWKNDKKPGDVTGDGMLKGAWHVAQP
jgi:predicted lipoprotein with Yx(FWY)xxD motif